MINKTRLKNIVRGVRTVMDICPHSDYGQNSNQRSDAEALRQDWDQVGKDLKRAINKSGYEKG